MKLQILSDLQCECRPPPLPADADVVVAAGDIGAKKWTLTAIDGWLARAPRCSWSLATTNTGSENGLDAAALAGLG